MIKPGAWDKHGIPILPGDLLQTYHFRDGRRNMYLYHIATLEKGKYLTAMPYRGDGSGIRIFGKQESTEVIAGLNYHDIDDPMIQKRYRKCILTGPNGEKKLLCAPHERVRVKEGDA